MATFPSAEWMAAYAAAVLAHPDAYALAESLAGRYRFVVNPAGGLEVAQAHDLLVLAGPAITATSADAGEPTTLTVTADYKRWRGLIEGKADFVMSFLLRRIKIDGDIGWIRSKGSEAKPLLDCLRNVPTEFAY